MKEAGIIYGLLSIVLFACGEQNTSIQNESITIESFTLNGEEISLAAGDYRIQHDVVYFSESVYEKYTDFYFKDIVPGKQIGICSDDLCVSYYIYQVDDLLKDNGKVDLSRAFQDDGAYFAAVEALIPMLVDDLVWDSEKRTLKITIEEFRDSEQDVVSETFGKKGSRSLSYISLPDLSGNAVSLASFEGKKVAVFAWASW